MKIPQEVKMEVAGGTIQATGPKGKASCKYDPAKYEVKIENGELSVKYLGKKLTRAFSATLHAIEAHGRNLVTGVTHGYSKKLTIVFSHFPVTVEVKGQVMLIKNFMGEKSPRHAKLVAGTTVQVGKGEITVSGSDREAVGQTAANIIAATYLTKRDRRVFQDGIYHAIA